ncbi:MAG: Archaeal ATPase [Firmicutes bacterium ADurb.Bin354]|nr:MAG: Archaeal ATPase [Firmicutes bacterium ADurb.Bin354]
MKENPFKFGTVVDGIYFTDREDEQSELGSYLKSENHVIIISPRRFGKTSLIKKILAGSGRRFIYLDMQLVLSEEDFAAQLLKRVYKVFPGQKIKNYIKSFRIIPSLIMNPVTGEIEISFTPGSRDLAPLEDVLNLIEKLGKPENKVIVVLDEFQDTSRINLNLNRMLRPVLQVHKSINYVFMGSSESMIREIFEKKDSPFYRFGILYPLGKIPQAKFRLFLEYNFTGIVNDTDTIAGDILKITGSHPYYTQQLAFMVWELIYRTRLPQEKIADLAADEIVTSHDKDFELLWNTLNRTDMMVLAGMSESDTSPLSDEFSKQFGTGASSTVFSTLKRLIRKGMIVKEDNRYLIDDPFFKRWIRIRRRAF